MTEKSTPRTSVPEKLRKRDGSITGFDETKIRAAVEKAAYHTWGDRERARAVAQNITDIVLKTVSKGYKRRIPTVEGIQDTIETALMNEGYIDIARNYILYRQERSEIRFAKSTLDLKDDLKLPLNTMEVLKRRYLLKDDLENIIETPSEMFRRVASHVARAESKYRSDMNVGDVEENFYLLMRNREFMPNSPTLMNAGTSFGQLSACFVLPLEDSMDSIFEALKNMAKIHQTGGGTGFSFSKLRPKGALVSTTKGRASGPVSFMSIFDKATGVILQGGRRRGANMGILRCDHPDIGDFIEAKISQGGFENFNLSVAVTNRFMNSVKEDKDFDLRNPATGKKTRSVRAKPIFDLIVNAAWRTGDPGLVFIDQINRKNPTPRLGKIEATNPCGELPLLPFESCNLGSINLAKMVNHGRLDWQKLKHCVYWGIRFLDNVIDVNKYPLPQIKEMTLGNRKIGLGVMGFADMLIRLGIPYTSKAALDLAEKLMRFLHKESLSVSSSLAEKRGPFPNFDKSIYAKKAFRLRNAAVNTIAPTGTISIIAGCSSGIEPLFAISFVRNALSGTKFLEVSPLFESAAKERGLYKDEILAEIARKGSLRTVKAVPEELKRVFVTAFDVDPLQHLKIQSAFQKHTDNAVSKTINLPQDASVEDIKDIYLKAYELKCKGITIYRYGSKKEQVLSFGAEGESLHTPYGQFISAQPEYSGGCAAGRCAF